VQELQHARAAFGGLVESHVELRDALEAQARAQLAPHEYHRPVERGERLVAFRARPDDADPDACVAKVWRGLDIRDRHEADSRVLYIALEQRTDFLP
jgi:hypothetical protein